MKSYGYTSVVSMLLCLGYVLGDTDSCVAEDCSTTSPSPLSTHLPADHPCRNVQAPENVDITNVMGKWYALALMSPEWNRIPFCDTVEFVTNTTLELNWRSLDLIENPEFSSIAEYSTTLDLVQPGIWVDTKPDQGPAVYLLQITWHPLYLVLIKCYPNRSDYFMEVFVLGRYKDFEQRDLDMLLNEVKEQGVDGNLLKTQYLLWSMCRNYSHLE